MWFIGRITYVWIWNATKRLKHEVLTAVARLSIEENLTKENIEKIPYEIIKGEKARYRCCVYKEREVVLERAQLALSLTPNSKYGDINPDSVSLDTDEQIIYIVEAACDRCPINEFTVTELCRGVWLIDVRKHVNLGQFLI